MNHFTFATHNENKVKEVQSILKNLNIKINSLADLGIHDEIEEDGSTLKENAWIKADFVYKKLRGNVIAEDTGLEVTSLHGQPGVFSARYAGKDRNAMANMAKLLSQLEKLSDRSAQFRTVLAVWYEDKQYTFEGVIKGRIAKNLSGTGGFGYDPVFIPVDFGKSFASLSPEIKNSISHRGRAFESFRQFIERRLNDSQLSTPPYPEI